jgi:hypothetical protein
MNNELHRYLDGELAAESLDAEDRKDGDEWDRMVASFRVAAPEGRAPPWLEQKVMSEIASLPEQGVIGRLVAWLLNPATVRISPLVAGLVTAAFVLVLMLPGRAAPPVVAGTSGGTGGAAPVVYVQFMLEAPGATTVAVAGDFSEWEPTFTLDDADGDGVWTGRVPVRPGVHSYMFVIDGTEWQTDPRAERYQDDGFGNRNAVLAVAASE